MDILSDDKFYLNSVSCEEVGLYCDTLPIPEMAQLRYTTWNTGADEDRTAPDDTFEDVEYTITAYRFLPETLDNTAVHEFLFKPQTLQLSILPGVYFKIRQVRVRTTTEYDNRRIQYTIVFTLAPFRYAVDNPEITLDTPSGTAVVVSGNRYSKPVFKVNVPGQYLAPQSIILTVNGQTITVGLPDQAETVIDSEREIIYYNDQLLRDNAVGKYPLLSPGDNIISWVVTAGVSTVKLIKNERWY